MESRGSRGGVRAEVVGLYEAGEVRWYESWDAVDRFGEDGGVGEGGGDTEPGESLKEGEAGVWSMYTVWIGRTGEGDGEDGGLRDWAGEVSTKGEGDRVGDRAGSLARGIVGDEVGDLTRDVVGDEGGDLAEESKQSSDIEVWRLEIDPPSEIEGDGSLKYFGGSLKCFVLLRENFFFWGNLILVEHTGLFARATERESSSALENTSLSLERDTTDTGSDLSSCCRGEDLLWLNNLKGKGPCFKAASVKGT